MVVLFVSFFSPVALERWFGMDCQLNRHFLCSRSFIPDIDYEYFGMLVEFSLIISKQSEWIKQSAQEIGLLKLELEKLHQKLEEAENSDTTELQNEFIKQQENESET